MLNRKRVNLIKQKQLFGNVQSNEVEYYSRVAEVNKDGYLDGEESSASDLEKTDDLTFKIKLPLGF